MTVCDVIIRNGVEHANFLHHGSIVESIVDTKNLPTPWAWATKPKKVPGQTKVDSRAGSI